MHDELLLDWPYINDFHRKSSLASQKEVLEMSKHPFSREEVLAQEKRRTDEPRDTNRRKWKGMPK